MSQPYAAGSLVSTVDAASWQKAFTPYTLDGGAPTKYGYGWMLDEIKGAPTIGHGGGINGFRSFALRMPSAHLYAAVLSNADSGLVAPQMVAEQVAAIAIGKPYLADGAPQLQLSHGAAR